VKGGKTNFNTSFEFEEGDKTMTKLTDMRLLLKHVIVRYIVNT